MARWYSPLMSIETAWIELLAFAELVEEALQGGAVAAGWHHTIAPVAWSATVVR